MRSILVLLAVFLSAPGVTKAHAVGDVFAVNLPFSYLALAAASALAYSFAAFLVFSVPDTIATRAPRVLAIVPRGVRIAAHGAAICTVIAAYVYGLCGPEDPLRNFATIFLWHVLLLGVLYVSALVADIWPVTNPFRALARVLHIGERGLVRYPSIGYTPALAVYVLVVSFELFSNGASALPYTVSWMFAVYAAISLAGAALFGREIWFSNADFFTVLFGFAGRMAPLHVHRGHVEFPAFSTRLVDEYPSSWSAVAFITFMLASTSFDGLADTQFWYEIRPGIPFSGFLGLLSVWFVTVALYVSAVRLMRVPSSHTARRTLRFAYSLIPIAIAYNIAHYFTLLTGPLTPHAVWAVQVSVVIAGHVYATYVAHRIALKDAATQRGAFWSQIPMLLLMVFFTVFALWILSLGIRPE